MKLTFKEIPPKRLLVSCRVDFDAVGVQMHPDALLAKRMHPGVYGLQCLNQDLETGCLKWQL